MLFIAQDVQADPPPDPKVKAGCTSFAYMRKANSAMNLIKKLFLGAEWIILPWSWMQFRASLNT